MRKKLITLGVSIVLAFGIMGFSATPFNKAVPQAQAVSWTNCYWAIDGFQWCYKRCAQWEIIILREPNCNRWVRYGTIFA